MTDNQTEIAQNWPVPDLPSNQRWTHVEYGVFLDKTDVGHGITLLEVTRDPARAAASRRHLGPRAHVRQRQVEYTAWSGAHYDDGSPLSTPDQSEGSGN